MSLFDFYGQFFLKNMIELIKVETNSKEQQVVSARELYDFLGYDKSQWARWYKKNIEDNDFAMQLVDYEPIDRMSSKENGNFAKDFAITIDFAKKLSMMAKTEKGEEARNYFLNCEKKLMNPKLPNFEDPAEAAIAWAKEYKEKQLALKQIEEQKEIIEIQAPKVEFAEQLLKSTNAIDFSTASKAMNLPFGRNKLFEKLRELKILDARNNPYQNYVDRGYFTILETSFVHPKTGDRQMTFKTMITASGQDYVLKNLRKNNIIN
jgi:phage anti-repressor protein/phage antirepressor YoqD-like protein